MVRTKATRFATRLPPPKAKGQMRFIEDERQNINLGRSQPDAKGTAKAFTIIKQMRPTDTGGAH